MKNIMVIRNLASRKFIGSKIQRHLEFWITPVLGHRSSNPLTKENSLTGRKAYIHKKHL
ncbi:hypothetical protein C8N25_101115 [Algoriphagus antarcticus]|uniref:Uncharacterized protein n=1 Tax=Algoriphagus antarcticus TaxID=238540 RepID=A0A3E0E9G4_9BACT|nr:hypothetical protein C8N25_101115 [Algoriphagus antarcticus]